ncbi:MULTISPECIES: hypothetical protein [unclassified Rhizobium]
MAALVISRLCNLAHPKISRYRGGRIRPILMMDRPTAAGSEPRHEDQSAMSAAIFLLNMLAIASFFMLKGAPRPAARTVEVKADRRR